MGVKLLGKIKIHELAKDLNLTSKEVIEKANELGIEAKTHMSGIDEKDAEKIRNSYGKKLENKSENKTDSKSKSNKTKSEVKAKKEEKKEAPVIIRREVIITEEEKKETKNKQAEQKSKQVGFVERNKNADYNIVYRNKPTKPMTVSELFGLGKKEEPKKEEKTEKVEKIEKAEIEKEDVEKKEEMVETIKEKKV